VVLPRGWTRQMGRRCRGSRLSRLRPVRPVERAGQRASGLRFADPRRTTGLELETSGSVPIAKGDGSQVRSGLADGGNRIRTIGPAPAKGSSGRRQSETATRKAEPLTGSGPRRRCLPGVVPHSLSLRGGTASSNPSSSATCRPKRKSSGRRRWGCSSCVEPLAERRKPGRLRGRWPGL
jgi:hypothetical protein